MKCELDCSNCHPKEYCSWKGFSAYNNLGRSEAISLGHPKMPMRETHTILNARRPIHITSGPANIGGGTPPAIVTEHEELKEFIPDELNTPEDEFKIKEEMKKR